MTDSPRDNSPPAHMKPASPRPGEPAPAAGSARGPAPVLPYASPLPAGPDSQTLPGSRVVLSYMAPRSARDVTAARCATSAEAEMIVGQLSAAGILAQITDRNTEVLGPYAGGATVKVMVLADDAAKAQAVLRDEVEPIGGPADMPAGADGEPIGLLVAAAFDTPRALREAAAILAASRVKPYLPTLIPRSQCTPGEGSRFRLWVERDELDRARELLDEQDEEDDDEPEPRCPRCRAWRVHKDTSMMEEIVRFLGFGRQKSSEYECLKCRYRGPEAEFLGGRS